MDGWDKWYGTGAGIDAVQGKTGPDQTGMDWTGPGYRAGQGRAGQGRAWQGRRLAMAQHMRATPARWVPVLAEVSPNTGQSFEGSVP
jgi:hypothetical protein